MDIEEIRQLARIANENNLESIELHSDNTLVIIKMASRGVSGLETDASYTTSGMPSKSVGTAEETRQVYGIKSPMVGVFYSAPAPENEPFVRVGSNIKKGDVLCIIEAMKLLNEIASDRDGEIARICVENGEVVEFGQPLFEII